MAIITPASVVTLTDKLAAGWNAVLGTVASGYGLGTTGDTARAYKKALDLETLIQAIADTDTINALLPTAKVYRTNVEAYASFQSDVQSFLQAMHNYCAASGLTNVAGLDSFANYYNIQVGSPWQCLFAPDFHEAYKAWKGSYGTNYNYYYEVLQGATYQGNTFTNGLYKIIANGTVNGTGTVDGFAIDYSSSGFAGGFGQLNCSGITGTGVVSVTGIWRRAADGVTYTGVGTVNVTGNGTFVLTPPTANDLLLDVTGVTLVTGLTAGTIYVEAKRPTGRTNPPV